FALSTIPKEDPAVYRMLQRADSIGVFQVESRAQMSMLPRLKPQEFYDLVIEVAIVRPGPIQGDMVHPYLRRRQGLEPVSFPSKELEAVLDKTLGVPLFQEQAMKIAIVAGGFTPGEADKLRRAMATCKRTGTIGTFKTKMIEGMVARNYPRDFAERCFSQIEGFGEYGFPESHAASFALLVYASAWLKCRYPDVFAAALLNAQPMGFYAPAQIVRDLREHGVEVRPVDVNHSHWDATLEPGPHAAARVHPLHRDMVGDIRTTHALRLGFRKIKGLSEQHGRSIVQNRAAGYTCLRDLWLRTGLSPRIIERLADADAFGSLRLRPPGPARGAGLGGAEGARPGGRGGRGSAVVAWAGDASARGGRPATRGYFGPARARRAAAAHAAGRRGRERLPLPRTVAAPASGELPARRPRPPRHHPQRGITRAAVGCARQRLRPRHRSPAAGLGQWRHLHDHRRRDRGRQHHRLAEDVRALSSHHHGRALCRRERRAAAGVRGHPCRGGEARGSHRAARAPDRGCTPDRGARARRRGQAPARRKRRQPRPRPPQSAAHRRARATSGFAGKRPRCSRARLGARAGAPRRHENRAPLNPPHQRYGTMPSRPTLTRSA